MQIKCAFYSPQINEMFYRLLIYVTVAMHLLSLFNYVDVAHCNTHIGLQGHNHPAPGHMSDREQRVQLYTGSLKVKQNEKPSLPFLFFVRRGFTCHRAVMNMKRFFAFLHM